VRSKRRPTILRHLERAGRKAAARGRCEARRHSRLRAERIGGRRVRYCCVQAVTDYRELGYEAVLINCNPETVSTDYDKSNPYFEAARERGARGRARAARGVGSSSAARRPSARRSDRRRRLSILGTPFRRGRLAEDSERSATCRRVGSVPGTGGSPRKADAAARSRANRLPVLVRRRTSLGGRRCASVTNTSQVVTASPHPPP